ncbi:hypothetical protein ACIRO1_45330 [Streptomyces sp. NPDC102381]|uniref:hypothetical protein n=1 Tax=Streptomyces sp. NPDC102381 TaxID=3366164 RepID=UPI003827FE3F
MAITPEKMLTGLVGEVALLDDRVTKLEGKDPSSSIAGIHEALADIMAKIEKLEEKPKEEQAPPTPDWTTADQDRARELWDWLIKWCRETLYPMYAREYWRPCWYEHPQLRIQLTWLAHFHDWSREPKAPPTRAAEWHARWWPFVRDSVLGPSVPNSELFRCGHKVEDRTMLHAVPAHEDETAFEDGGLDSYVEEFIARRPKKEPKKKDETAG